MIQKFDRVFIHENARPSKLAARIQRLFPSEMVEWVTAKPFPDRRGELSAREFAESKRLLYIAPFEGSFFKRCPGSRPGLACCNYFVLNFGQQCDMDCSYCYLQSFINSPVLTMYSNLDQALEELRQIGNTMKDHALRVGTGEVVDSLSLDPITLFSRDLIAFFQEYPKWTLEFKTKSDRVDQFLDCEHAGNVIVSWSVNPQIIVESEEHKTASLAARLEAAEKCLAKGYKIAFHIDPMIYHPKWQDSYAGLVDEIHRRFTPDDVPYMSVGALRFQPEQRHLMRERFGMKSHVVRAEVFPGSDGKLRYDQALRQEMFQFVLKRFKGLNTAWNLFLCMESPESWLKVDATSPFKQEKLKPLFDPAVVRAYNRI